MSIVERMIGWLAEHGYRVEFKACVVAGHGEVWRAEAEDAEACLTEVLRQMLPSALSREVLNFERPAVDPPRPAAAPARAPVVDLRNVPEWDDADDVDDDEPAGDAPAAPRPTATTLVEDAAHVAALHAELTALTTEIDDAESADLGLFAPVPLRCQLVAWSATARDIFDRTTDSVVHVRAHGVLGRVVELSKRYWPGVVQTLAPKRTLESVAQELRVSGAQRWADVADHAEQGFEAATGGVRDAYGWSDEAALPPPPRDPEAALTQALALVDTVLPAREGERDSDLQDRARGLSSGAIDTLVKAARKLRWLRGATPAEAWGAAMGRLRRVAAFSPERLQRLADALDPAFSPPGSWAQYLSLQPEAKPVDFQPLPAHVTLDTLVDWLIEDGVVLDAHALHAQVQPHWALFMQVDTDSLRGSECRKLRKNVRRLQTGRIEPDSDAPAPIAPVELDDVPMEPDPADTAGLYAALRERLQGKTALFVTNRDDTLLTERLERTLGLSIDLCTVEKTRLVQAASDRIGQGTFDYVLIATSFIDHKSEASLRIGAGRAGSADTRCLRVGKGRVAAVAQALERDLNGQRRAA